MKSKAPLMLMEQMILLTVFALVAALCVQAFVKSDEISTTSESRDQAVICVQSIAELVRYHHGDISAAANASGGSVADGMLQIAYDASWNVINGADNAAYLLYAKPLPADVVGLYKARIWVVANHTNQTDELFSLEVMWQGGQINAENE